MNDAFVSLNALNASFRASRGHATFGVLINRTLVATHDPA